MDLFGLFRCWARCVLDVCSFSFFFSFFLFFSSSSSPSFSLSCFTVLPSASGSGQLGVSVATSATAGTPQGIAVPSLTPATQYDCYCATVSGGVLGTKLDLYSSGFTSHPAKNGDVAGTAITGRWWQWW